MRAFSARELGRIRKTFVLQHDQSDCGVACLLSIIRYYEGDSSLDHLRRISGTNTTGTTLLGLCEAAERSGFSASGCEGDMDALLTHGAPLIIHVQDSLLEHYIVIYGVATHKGGTCFVAGDPAKGIIYLPVDQVAGLWQTKACLVLAPAADFLRTADVTRKKRQWMRALVSNDLPMLTVAAAIGICIALLNMVMAVFSQQLLDDIIPNRNFNKFYLGISFALLLLFIKEIINAIRQFFLVRQSKDFNNRIINNFFSNLLQLPKPFFDTRKIGELTARLNDTARIQKLISQIAGNVLIDVLVLLVSLGFLCFYSWQAAAVTFAMIPLFYLIVFKHNRAIIGAQQKVMTAYALTESNYITTLQGIETIKNHNKQAGYKEQNQLVYNNYQEQVLQLGKIQIRLGLLANCASAFFLTSILFFTTYQVFQGKLKTGELIAILAICSSMLPALANLALLSIPLNEAKVAFNRMFEFVNLEPEFTELESEPYTSITALKSFEVKDLAFRFPGRSRLMKQVSFTVNKGEIVALMGENGSGKSTFCQLLTRAYALDAGHIIINGETNLQQVPIPAWRRLIGVVPQHISLFSGTVLETIAFEDARNSPEKVIRFLHEFGFSRFIEMLPQQYGTIIGENGIHLSGGQKQVIALARALYHQPQLLILDEATSAMDRETEKFVLQLLSQLKKEMAIIFITHELRILKGFCDRIYILDKGTISQFGSHDILLTSTNLYSTYWNDLKNGHSPPVPS